jgi:hypothetical protein
MPSDRARDFAVDLAGRQPRQRACLASFIGLAPRDLERRQALRRVSRAQEHHVRIFTVRRFAGVDQLHCACRRAAALPDVGEDCLRLLACVAPDMPTGDDEILFDERAAADEGLAAAGLSDID